MSRLQRLCGTTSVVGLSLAMIAGCGDTNSATGLRPEGAPEIMQVFVVERNVSETGAVRISDQIAYGDHPDIDETDDRIVANAVADSSQRIRVVFDELLLGNNLEEILCNDGSFSAVPVGADPNDIARCAGTPEQLMADCNGPFAVCIDDSTMPPIPVGILDEDEDKAPDQLRFIDDVVTLDCGGVDIPLNIAQTFYQPSGNQQIPAGPLGVDGLGPAIILQPARGLRSGASCTIRFTDAVVDKEGNRVCAPAAGAACVPGDTGGIDWSVGPMRVTATNPPNGATGINPDLAARILFLFNAVLDANTLGMESLGTYDVLVNGVPVDPATITLIWAMENPQQVIVQLNGGYERNAQYAITVAETQDQFGGALPAPFTLEFATGMGTPPPPDAAVPDAALPDASPADAAIDAM